MKNHKRPPIFILGCQRSGTSLFRRILDSHPHIACPPESAFIVQLAQVVENPRSFEGLQGMGFDRQQVLDRMGLFTAWFFEQYAQSKGKSRWADKTPHYVNHAQTIDAMFRGNLQYIGIVRNGLDVAYSLCGFDWGILKPYLAEGLEKPLAAIRFWRDQNRKLLDFYSQVGSRMYRIHYEDLTMEPEKILREVCEFLDEPWDPTLLEYNRKEHDTGLEDENARDNPSIVTNSGKYRIWPVELQQALFREAKEVLDELGYAYPDELTV